MDSIEVLLSYGEISAHFTRETLMEENQENNKILN